MIPISEPLWNSLCDIVRPYKVAEGEIEEIRVSFSLEKPGITASVKKPFPEIEHQDYDEQFSEIEHQDYDEYPKNKTVTFREPPAPRIKKGIVETLFKNVKNTPPSTSLGIENIIIRPEGIHVFYEIYKTGVDNFEPSLYKELADALVDENYLDKPGDFAGGNLSMYETEEEYIQGGDEGKYELDGTLYRFTRQPYKYWSAGRDTDYPTNIEEWAEFASNSEEEKERKLKKDKYRVHFHPSGIRVDENNSLVQIFKKVEKEFFDEITFTQNIKSFSLRDLYVGEGIYYFKGDFTVQSDEQLGLLQP